ncbi:MAG: hypothetical protein AAB502_11660 [Chloroflexota bacterium]
MKTLLTRLLVALVVGGFGLLAVMAPSMIRSASAQAVGALDHVTVTPASASLAPGATPQYTATAYDASNNVIPGATFAWSATSGGSINATGLLTASAVAGTYANAVQVTATFNSVTKSGTASFTVAPGALDRVTVTPASVSLATGGTQQYAATAYDASNNVIPGATFAWSVTSGGSINATGLLTAGAVAGTYANAVQASTTVSGVTKTASASFTMTASTPAPQTPNPIGIPALQALYNGLLHRIGFDHFLGIEAKVLDGQGNPMSLKAVAGKVTAVTQTSITIMLNGGTDIQTYTVSDKTRYIPAAQSGQKGLAGFQVNDKVTIGLVNGEVTLVAKVQPQVEKPRPVPSKERIEKQKDQIERLREQMNKRLDQLEKRLDGMKGDASRSGGNDKMSFSNGDNGRGPQFVPPGLAKNQGKQGRGHDKD